MKAKRKMASYQFIITQRKAYKKGHIISNFKGIVASENTVLLPIMYSTNRLNLLHWHTYTVRHPPSLRATSLSLYLIFGESPAHGSGHYSLQEDDIIRHMGGSAHAASNTYLQHIFGGVGGGGVGWGGEGVMDQLQQGIVKRIRMSKKVCDRVRSYI